MSRVYFLMIKIHKFKSQYIYSFHACIAFVSRQVCVCSNETKLKYIQLVFQKQRYILIYRLEKYQDLIPTGLYYTIIMILWVNQNGKKLYMHEINMTSSIMKFHKAKLHLPNDSLHHHRRTILSPLQINESSMHQQMRPHSLSC